MAEENQVTIEEPKEEAQEQIDISTEGLSQEEVTLARKNGLIPEEEKSQEKKESSEESKDEGEEASEDLQPVIEDLDSFEKVHDIYQRDVKTFYKLPRHIKNFYHNSKGLYKRLKEEEERRKDIESKTDFEKVKEVGARSKLDKIRERLQNPENLTVEELQDLVKMESQTESPDRPLTKKDLEEIEAKKASQEKDVAQKQRAVQEKVVRAEEYAKDNVESLTGGKYKSFDEVVALAQEVSQKKPRYHKLVSDAFSDENVSESEVVDLILDIAKLSPNWGTVQNGGNTVDRMVKNSQKKKTSASIAGGSGGGRVVSLDDLTPEDAAKLSLNQWKALPQKVRKRLLSQT